MFATRFAAAMVLSLILTFMAGGYIDQAVKDPFLAILLGGLAGYVITVMVLRCISP